MNFLSARGAFRVAAVVLTAACDLSTPTEVQNPIDLELDFCAGSVPIWLRLINGRSL